MLLEEIARTSVAVSESSARSAKVAALAACLRAVGPEEAPIAVAYLSGTLPHGPIGVGWAALRDLPPSASEAASLELLQVDAALRAIGAASGPGSQATRARALEELFARATELEQRFLARSCTASSARGRSRASSAMRSHAPRTSRSPTCGARSCSPEASEWSRQRLSGRGTWGWRASGSRSSGR